MEIFLLCFCFSLLTKSYVFVFLLPPFVFVDSPFCFDSKGGSMKTMVSILIRWPGWPHLLLFLRTGMISSVIDPGAVRKMLECLGSHWVACLQRVNGETMWKTSPFSVLF